MTGPDVTVIVPVYNTMPYLTACLDSLLGQSIGPGRLQVVAVDDGSTDGSGPELDRYAAAHPGVVTVVHQANSGGPARPCNVGLEHAAGRFVFFLGADDHLGPEALERLVAAADTWNSDVVCGRLVGVGGRWVNQRLFAETAESLPFPGELLSTALSNTKLFRRSLLEEHAIRYPEDLRVGSDQPFTIEAMLRARKISVLADYDYYFAVRREDAANITYSSSWRSRLADLGAVVRHVADLIEPGAGRDAVLGRHFQGEIATLLRRDFGELGASEQQAIVDGVNELTAAYLTEGLAPRLRTLARLRYALAAAQRLDGLRALIGAEDASLPLLLDGDHVWLQAERVAPGLGAGLPADLFALNLETRKQALVNAIGAGTASLDGSCLVLELPTSLHPDSAPFVRGALVRATEGASRPPRRTPRRTDRSRLATPVRIVADRAAGAAPALLRWRLDLADHLTHEASAGVWALRIQLDVGKHTYGLPVLAAPVGRPAGESPPSAGSLFAPGLELDGDGRTLLRCEPL